MEIQTIRNELSSLNKADNALQQFKLFDSIGIQIYPKSFQEYDGIIFFIARSNGNKNLYLYYENLNSGIPEKFEGSLITVEDKNNIYLKKCLLNTKNRKIIQ